MGTSSNRFLGSGFLGIAVLCAWATSLGAACDKRRPEREGAPAAVALARQEPAAAAAPATPPPEVGAAIGSAPTSAPAQTTGAVAAVQRDDAAPKRSARSASALTRGHGSRRRPRDGAQGRGPDPASAAASTPDRLADAVAPDLRVVRFVVAKGVSGREPVGAATTFQADDLERVYAFVEFANASQTEGRVEVVFAPSAGGPSHRVQLDVGAQPRWRTWATSRKARAPGAWTATVRAADGRSLASTTFEIAP